MHFCSAERNHAVGLLHIGIVFVIAFLQSTKQAASAEWIVSVIAGEIREGYWSSLAKSRHRSI